MENVLEFIIKKYNVDLANAFPAYLKISRWKEFPMLLNELKFKKGAEIGVYKAQYAKALVELIPGLDLTGVDAWKGYRGYRDYRTKDLEITAYNESRLNAEKYGFKLIRGWSMEAVSQFEDESLDFVFIDSNHDFAHTVEDINAWSKKVKKGGIVSGHDYFEKHHRDYRVKEAVQGWCAANGIKTFFVVKNDQDPSWFYIK